ncbi:hypothetical protein TRAPUB_11028 [Trametes pubescens]|uniref:Fungal-type protein kinase domain-containing protein n=1 Tax=Trametes pubescens TaxID=154538 RepID=A0A1M2VXV1_TRAPU|nr:hypothetical protein TRAPUB_11028 [Trametes pubescens]
MFSPLNLVPIPRVEAPLRSRHLQAQAATTGTALDPTRRASSEGVKKMLACAESASLGVQKQVHDATGRDKTTKSFEDSQGPLHEITMAERTFLVGRPLYVDTSAAGRRTRTYVARDVQQNRLCVLKDSRRPNVAASHPEHLTYKRLREGDIQSILSCEVGGDVQEGSGSNAAIQVTEVQSFLDSKPAKRIHHYTVSKEVFLLVTEFSNFRQLSFIMCMVLLGFLNDWDVYKSQDELVTEKGHHLDRTGTWQFRSALSLRYPKKPYSLPDDIESFIHVFHYLVVRDALTDRTTHLKAFVRMTYDQCTLRELDGALVGGATKLRDMDTRSSPIVPLGNPTLRCLLEDMAGLCNDHRNQITLTTFDQLYGPPDPLSIQALQALTPTPEPKENHEGTAALTAHRTIRHPRALPSSLSEANVPALVSFPSNPDDLYGASPFRTHEALVQVFADWHGSSVSWEGDVKCEDLFATRM